MPLDTDPMVQSGVTYGFNDPIRCKSGDLKATWINQSLTVVGVHMTATNQAFHKVHPPLNMVICGGQGICQVLLKLASAMEPHQLHTEADAKYRKTLVFLKLVEQFHLECLTARINQIGFWMQGFSELPHVWIITTCENDGVNRLDHCFCATGNRWKNQRCSASVPYRLKVGIPQGHPSIFQIGSKTDGWSQILLWHTKGSKRGGFSYEEPPSEGILGYGGGCGKSWRDFN